MSGAEITLTVLGAIFAVLFLAFVLLFSLIARRLAAAIVALEELVRNLTSSTVPLLGEVTSSVTQVNSELQRVDAIAAHMQSVSANVSALTGLFAATIGSPLVKVAAFSYGVRQAAGKRAAADLEKRLRAERKAERALRRSTRRALPSDGGSSQ
jgi:predicted PurR-regulated permease PerM